VIKVMELINPSRVNLYDRAVVVVPGRFETSPVVWDCLPVYDGK
jgi:hypothetical protein